MSALTYAVVVLLISLAALCLVTAVAVLGGLRIITDAAKEIRQRQDAPPKP